MPGLKLNSEDFYTEPKKPQGLVLNPEDFVSDPQEDPEASADNLPSPSTTPSQNPPPRPTITALPDKLPPLPKPRLAPGLSDEGPQYQDPRANFGNRALQVAKETAGNLGGLIKTGAQQLRSVAGGGAQAYQNAPQAENKPIVPLSKMTTDMPAGPVKGVTTGVLQGIEGLTTPENMAIGAGMEVMPSLAVGAVGKATKAVLDPALKAYFSWEMGKGLKGAGQEAYAAWQQGDYEGAARSLGLGTVDAMMLWLTNKGWANKETFQKVKNLDFKAKTQEMLDRQEQGIPPQAGPVPNQEGVGPYGPEPVGGVQPEVTPGLPRIPSRFRPEPPPNEMPVAGQVPSEGPSPVTPPAPNAPSVSPAISSGRVPPEVLRQIMLDAGIQTADPAVISHMERAVLQHPEDYQKYFPEGVPEERRPNFTSERGIMPASENTMSDINSELGNMAPQPDGASTGVGDSTGPTVPETPETIGIQLQQLVQGQRRVVMLPEGTNDPGFEMPGYQYGKLPGVGAFYFDPAKIQPREIVEAVKNGRLNEVLGAADGGMGAPPKEGIQGEPVAVVGRDPQGNTVQGTVTDIPNVDRTLEVTRGLTPEGGTVSVESPEAEIQNRLEANAPPKRWTVTDLTNGQHMGEVQGGTEAQAKRAATRAGFDPRFHGVREVPQEVPAEVEPPMAGRVEERPVEPLAGEPGRLKIEPEEFLNTHEPEIHEIRNKQGIPTARVIVKPQENGEFNAVVDHQIGYGGGMEGIGPFRSRQEAYDAALNLLDHRIRTNSGPEAVKAKKFADDLRESVGTTRIPESGLKIEPEEFIQREKGQESEPSPAPTEPEPTPEPIESSKAAEPEETDEVKREKNLQRLSRELQNTKFSKSKFNLTRKDNAGNETTLNIEGQAHKGLVVAQVPKTYGKGKTWGIYHEPSGMHITSGDFTPSELKTMAIRLSKYADFTKPAAELLADKGKVEEMRRVLKELEHDPYAVLENEPASEIADEPFTIDEKKLTRGVKESLADARKEGTGGEIKYSMEDLTPAQRQKLVDLGLGAANHKYAHLTEEGKKLSDKFHSERERRRGGVDFSEYQPGRGEVDAPESRFTSRNGYIPIDMKERGTWYSNGHFMAEGEPPKPWYGVEQALTELKDKWPEAPTNIKDPEKLAEAIRAHAKTLESKIPANDLEKIARDLVPNKAEGYRLLPGFTKGAKEVHPVAYQEGAAKDKPNMVILSNGSGVSATYFDHLMKKFPDAKLSQSDKNNGLVFSVKGKPVGVIMPMKMESRSYTPALETILKGVGTKVGRYADLETAEALREKVMQAEDPEKSVDLYNSQYRTLADLDKHIEKLRKELKVDDDPNPPEPPKGGRRKKTAANIALEEAPSSDSQPAEPSEPSDSDGPESSVSERPEAPRQSVADRLIPEGAKQLISDVKRIPTQIKSVATPAGVSRGSEEAGRIVSQMAAERARRRDVLSHDLDRAQEEALGDKSLAHKAARVLSIAKTYMDTLSQAERYDFIDRFERGEKQADEGRQKIADVVKDHLKSREQELSRLGLLKTYYEHYFPRAWKTGPDGQPLTPVTPDGQPMEGRRPLEGSKSWAKARTFKTFMEGIEAGYTPFSENPLEMLQYKVASMDQAITARKAGMELKAKGLLRFIKPDNMSRAERMGMARINDPIGEVQGPRHVTAQEWYDPHVMDRLEELAKLNGIKLDRQPDIGKAPGVAGYARKSTGEVKTKSFTPESVLAHEIGHQLEWKYGLNKKLKSWMSEKGGPGVLQKGESPGMGRKEILDEMNALSDLRFEGFNPTQEYKDYARNVDERIANAIAAFVYAPEKFREVAPNMYEALRDELHHEPGLKPLFDVKRSMVIQAKDVKLPIDKGESKVVRGYWMAPEPVARVLNNYLSPGLNSNALFRAYRDVGNLHNSLQLGLSAFHLGFTSLDAGNSRFALGTYKIAHAIGDKGIDAATKKRWVMQGVKDMLSTPGAPVTNAYRGDALLKEWSGESSGDPLAKEIAGVMEEAGARAKMDSPHNLQITKKMMDAFRAQAPVWEKGLKGAGRVPFAVAEQVMRPVLEYVVPRQKLGVFYDMARFELERLKPETDKIMDRFEQAEAAHAEAVEGGNKSEIRAAAAELREAQKEVNRIKDLRRERLQKAWASVDNRMGQMVYDNLHWNKVTKDILMASVRSVGWNWGSLREIGGSVADTARYAKDTAGSLRGKDVTPEFTHRMAYLIGMTAVSGMTSAMLQYLWTGKAPSSLKDVAFPRGGEEDQFGEQQRWVLPWYGKDIYHYLTDFKKTVSNKIHPTIQMFQQMITNRDYWNTQIWNPDDPPIKQLEDQAKFVLQNMTPFAITGYKKAGEAGAPLSKKLLPFIGITPAPRDINQTPAERMMDEYSQEEGKKARTKEDFERLGVLRRLRQSLRQGKGVTGEAQEALKAGKLNPRDIARAKSDAKMTSFAKRFQALDLPKAVNVWESATDEEKNEVRRLMQMKIKSGLSRPGGIPAVTKEKMNKLGLTGPVQGAMRGPAAPHAPETRNARSAGVGVMKGLPEIPGGVRKKFATGVRA